MERCSRGGSAGTYDNQRLTPGFTPRPVERFASTMRPSYRLGEIFWIRRREAW
jgi:hypothetical protein